MDFKPTDKASMTVQTGNFTQQYGVYIALVGQLNFQAEASIKASVVAGWDTSIKLGLTCTVKMGATLTIGASLFAINTHSGFVSFLSASKTVKEIETRGKMLQSAARFYEEHENVLNNVRIVTETMGRVSDFCRFCQEFTDVRSLITPQTAVVARQCTKVSGTVRQTVQTLKETIESLTQTIDRYTQVVGKDSEQAQSLTLLSANFTESAGQITIN